jgi:hypothetical protein
MMLLHAVARRGYKSRQKGMLGQSDPSIRDAGNNVRLQVSAMKRTGWDMIWAEGRSMLCRQFGTHVGLKSLKACNA